MTLRLLHTADWQLGRNFTGMPPEKAGLVREARFEAVRTIARLAGEHRVDAVLVAGDVFDDNLVGAATCARSLATLRGFLGPWILLPGNHDADTAVSVWSRLRRAGLPEQVVVADESTPLVLCDGRLAVLPAPLKARRVADDLSAWMDGAVTPSGALRVGLAHGSVAGVLPGDADAANPIAADRAERACLDYLALGDWHGAVEIGPRTWYAGTPEPDRFATNAAGRVLLVELEGVGAAPRVVSLATAQHSWHTAGLDCTGLDESSASDAIEALLPPPETRHRALLRLRLEGLVSFATRAALEQVTERLAGEVLWLDVIDEGLAGEPDERDLQVLARSPVTAAATRVLQEACAAGPEAGRDLARHALRLLYAEAAALEAAP
jgi:DNA repair exonuclease SbcCD nuclease subunit